MDLETRLTQLEVKFDERWKAHDERATEVWTGIKADLQEIKEKMVCGVHEERIKTLSSRLNWVYLFIAGLISAIVGVAFKK